MIKFWDGQIKHKLLLLETLELKKLENFTWNFYNPKEMYIIFNWKFIVLIAFKVDNAPKEIIGWLEYNIFDIKSSNVMFILTISTD